MLFDHVSEQNIVPYLVATPLYTHTHTIQCSRIQCTANFWLEWTVKEKSDSIFYIIRISFHKTPIQYCISCLLRLLLFFIQRRPHWLTDYRTLDVFATSRFFFDWLLGVLRKEEAFNSVRKFSHWNMIFYEN